MKCFKAGGEFLLGFLGDMRKGPGERVGMWSDAECVCVCVCVKEKV